MRNSYDLLAEANGGVSGFLAKSRSSSSVDSGCRIDAVIEAALPNIPDMDPKTLTSSRFEELEDLDTT